MTTSAATTDMIPGGSPLACSVCKAPTRSTCVDCYLLSPATERVDEIARLRRARALCHRPSCQAHHAEHACRARDGVHGVRP